MAFKILIHPLPGPVFCLLLGSNLPCDWLSTAWAYSKQETENGTSWWLATSSAWSHYLNQCWLLVTWTLGDILEWNRNQNTQIQKYTFEVNTSENVVCKMATTLSRPQSVNSSPPGQNGRHLTDDIFRCFLMNEKFCILIKISLKFVPKGPINNY